MSEEYIDMEAEMESSAAQVLAEPIVFYVDDDEAMCESIRFLIESVSLKIKTFSSAKKFLDEYVVGTSGCLLLDVRMPEMSGLELQEQLRKRNINIPIIFITGHGDVPMAIRAMKAGAVDFLTKPFNDQALLDSIQSAIEIDQEQQKADIEKNCIIERVKKLTPREFEVMKCVVKGNLNKITAYELGISSKTVELHRAKIMEKMQAKSLAHLVKMVLTYEGGIHHNYAAEKYKTNSLTHDDNPDFQIELLPRQNM